MPAEPRKTVEIQDMLDDYLDRLTRDPVPDPERIRRVRSASHYMHTLDRNLEEIVTVARRGMDSPRYRQLKADPPPPPPGIRFIR